MTDTFPFGVTAGDDDPYPFGLKEADTYPFTVRRRAIRGYGWRPDQPDHRDQIYAPSLSQTPAAVDLQSGQSLLPPVYDQGALGSCTGNAIAAAIQFARAKQGIPDADLTPSRLFIYFGERVIEGAVDSDPGASLRDGIKVVATDGACFESGDASWPYVISRFADRPPNACFAAAKKDEVVSYSRLNQNAAHMEACLAEGYPFAFGFAAFADLQSPEVRESGMLSMPDPGAQPIGGHAVLAVGYDRGKQLFKIRNSWGPDWGQGGYFWMPYDYLTGPQYSNDFWTIRLVEK